MERTAARDRRDLGHEARSEEQEDLGGLAERELPSRRLDAVLATELRGLAQELLPAAALRVERAEQELAHAHAALAEPAQRCLVEPRMPVLIRHVGAHAAPELRRDAIRGLTDRRERAVRLTRAGKHRRDRLGPEAPVAARRPQQLDLARIRPPPQRVGVDAEHPARRAEGQPLSQSTAKLRESRWGRSPVGINPPRWAPSPPA